MSAVLYSSAAVMAAEEQQNAACAFLMLKNIQKLCEENAMESTILEELIGKEVTVGVFNAMPIKGTVVSVDCAFVKIEGPTKNFNKKEYYVNKAMISSITVK